MGKTVKSRNLSIMMTDIQGYTSTSAMVGRQQSVDLIRRHNQLMVPVIEFYGGTIIKTIGDAFLVTFESSTDAVICAIIIQLLLREYNAKAKDPTQKLNLRVVVNSGDVTLEGNDIFGTAVNITARMEALPCFPGGSIGISESTYLLMDKGEIVAEKIGPQQLKGIPDPVTVYSVPLEKQKLTSLPVNLLELVEQVVAGKAPATPGAQAGGDALATWNQSVVKFLKEKNWGENVQQLGQNIGKNLSKVQQQLGQNISQMQKSVAATLAGKTVVEAGNRAEFRPVSAGTRLGCFLIDFGVMVVAGMLLQIIWWVAGGMLGVLLPGFLMGMLQALVALLYLALCFLYFALFWKYRGATIGQIYGKCGVVKSDGSPVDWRAACLRSALFLASCLLLGVGAWFILLGKEQEALYDKFSGTKVVE
ncbi:MAG: Adenylate cyclase [Candidatus Ozemobacter sibiricus]|jgi:class 3 adenylate cyclase/uncharacterized RDD family membrane protein YckC|uniref:Adenylate cyclase n=1 Tax=Candidatus Ozemobacter sibiricus TaxID=2268124 RepID=A0A367ZN42_9BACT|nr:MAG: Adenylate cyclase [Candidatus Ozemobacter sibiricus]